MTKHWMLGSCVVLALLCLMVGKSAEVAPPPAAEAKGPSLKIDGRLFAGVFSTGSDGEYPRGSLTIPDAKIRFTFSPSKDITIVNRFSNDLKANQAKFDNYYVDMNNWAGAVPGHTVRVGKFSVGVGEEVIMSNLVEGILITNSAAAVSGYDEGLAFFGPLPTPLPMRYTVMVTNGTKDVSTASDGYATSVKLSMSPRSDWYLSGSYYSSGDLVTSDGTLAQSDLKIAGLQSASAGAASWRRGVWEADIRYHYGPNGVRPIVGSEPVDRFQLAAAYGQFTDDATGAADRTGDYWYVEGLTNVTPRVYLAARVSQIRLDGETTATLNGVAGVNSYRRLSLGGGYRLTTNTHLRAEYTVNRVSDIAPEPKLNQFAIGIAAKF